MSANIIIVEDNPTDVVLLREALEEHGVQHEAVVLEDGEQAYQFFATNFSDPRARPCVIILDLNLPKRDGLEVLQALRKSDFHDVPVVVLTTSDSPAERQSAELLGVRAYLRKPVDLESFISIGGILKEFCKTG